MATKNEKYFTGIAANLALAVATFGAPNVAHTEGIGESANSVSLQSAGAAAGHLRLTDARTILPYIIKKFEGSGVVQDDNGHGATKWGVNSEAHGLTKEQVLSLTYKQAFRIMESKYYKQLNIDALPVEARLPAVDVAIVAGQDRAQKIIEAANGDANKIIDGAYDFYKGLAKSNPERYGADLAIWAKRQKALRRMVTNGLVAEVNPYGNQEKDRAPITEEAFFSLLPVSEKPRLIKVVADQTQQASSAPASVPAPNPPATHNAKDILMGGAAVALLGLVGAGAFYAGRRRRPVAADAKTGRIDPHFREDEATLGGAGDAAQADTSQNDAADAAARASRQQRPSQDEPSGAKAQSAGANDRGNTSSPPPNDFSAFNLNETESKAFGDVFGRYSPQTPDRGKTWNVVYPDHSQVAVTNGLLNMKGDGGIEDSVKYAAKAWGDKCVIEGGSKEYREKIAAAAQKLVNAGEIKSGFTIEGIGTFTVQPQAKPAQEQQESAAFRPADRGNNPGAFQEPRAA